MVKEYLSSFYDIYKAPVWLLVVVLGLFMVFMDSPKLLKNSKNEAMMIKTIGWVYIVGSTLIYVVIKVVR